MQPVGPYCWKNDEHSKQQLNEFTFNWLLINGIPWTGVISFDGCVLSLLTGAHALCLLVPTNQVRQNITPILSTILNM